MNDADRAIGAAIEHYGIPLATAKPGDVVVAHSTGIIGWLIRFGTHSHWNHVAVLTAVGDTPEDSEVVQAEAHGVELAKLSSVAPGGSWAILPCPAGVNRRKVVSAAKGMLRERYAFLTIASIAMKIVARWLHVPFRFAVRDTSTLICSAVGAISLLAGGWLRALGFSDLYQVTPAQIAVALVAEAAKKA